MRWLLLVPLVLSVMSAGPVAQTPPRPGATPNTLRLEEGAQRPPARIADLAWLAGQWVGEGLGGQIDETWSRAEGGAMVGYFRLVRAGKPVFYEILTLLEVDGSLELRLKHVNPDMTGWEDKNQFVTFKLVKHDESGAYFSGLTFKRTGSDSMDGYLALRDQSGTVREEKFTYRRVKD